MGHRLPSSLIFTTTARLDTSAAHLWPLLANPGGWPRWWAAIARCHTLAELPAHAPRASPGERWRVACGLPLHLRVATMASEWPEWQTLGLQGDLQGQLVFAVQPACSADNPWQLGVDLTCRCELPGHLEDRWLWRMLLEHRISRLTEALIRDLGQVLHCPARVLVRWRGSAWRG